MLNKIEVLVSGNGGSEVKVTDLAHALDMFEAELGKLGFSIKTATISTVGSMKE